MGTITADKVLDAKGLSCPLPVLKTKKMFNELSSGQILEIQATDPGSVADFNAWTKRTGNELMEHGQEGDVYTFFIKKT